MKSLDYAEAYIRYAVPVCVRGRIGRQVIPQIDAGIARKGHLWIGNERRQPGRLFHAGWAGRPAILIRSVVRIPSNILKKGVSRQSSDQTGRFMRVAGMGTILGRTSREGEGLSDGADGTGANRSGFLLNGF
ncbi:MAG: hypothetical protein DRH37_09000 [Deltaproteobacteria bacterium]|nr:MAG: hypothetical protein DRH37_09000 [Deltaproteobacteria bacterium]